MYNMLGINIPFDVYVYSTKGIKPIRNLTPGDKLYEYGTSNPLEVQEVLKSEIQTIWEILYNDGRRTYGIETTPVLYGNKIIPLKCAAKLGKFPPIETFAIDFQKDRISNPLFPDPYSAGALLIHGDYNDEYVNLPIEGRCEPNNFIRFRNNSEIADVLGKDKIYFSWAHTAGDKRITWKEFFPNYRIYVTSREATTPIIPVEYMEASILDRRKFIRGVFDVGFFKDVFPDQVGTINAIELHLQEVQKMLWSLGISSKIVYNPLINISRGKNFRLEILGKYENYPGFFYGIGPMNRVLDNDNRIIKKDQDFKLKVIRISKLNQGYTYEVRLNKPNAIYTSANFLPRVGL